MCDKQLRLSGFLRVSGFRDPYFGPLVLDAGEDIIDATGEHLLEAMKQMKEKKPWQSTTAPDNTDPNI